MPASPLQGSLHIPFCTQGFGARYRVLFHPGLSCIAPSALLAYSLALSTEINKINGIDATY